MRYSADDNARKPNLEVYLLGLLDYEQALRLQRRLVYDVSGSDGQLAALMLCEHAPVISIGRLGSRSHIRCDDLELSARRLSLRWINRGGGCNLHGPGQLACYSIMPVPPSQTSLGEYVRGLEGCLLELLREFSIQATTRPDHTGIWTPAGQIALMGIAVTRWVSYHGFTLNVAGRLDQFRILQPGAYGAEKVTTIEAHQQRPVAMAKVRECLVRKFTDRFRIGHYQIYSHHPMLKPVERPHVYANRVSC